MRKSGEEDGLSSQIEFWSATTVIWLVIRKCYFLALYFTFAQHDEAIGAIPLACYTLSLPTEVYQSFQRGSHL